MARIFITGSADGLGALAAQQLVHEGHQVVLHARNEPRGHEALSKVTGAETVLTGDLSDMADTKQLAAAVNASGSFDAIIHNAGVWKASSESILNINTLAPYILTCLIQKPKRLVYLGSDMHLDGVYDLPRLKKKSISYSDSKLYVVMLAMAVARLWPEVYSNAVDPGWVPTKMGGANASDDLEKGYQTQTWLATSEDAEAEVSGQYFYHKAPSPFGQTARSEELQNEFLLACRELTGVRFPRH